MGARTDFSRYSHQQLYAMLFASDPGTVSGAAQVWGDTAAALYDQAGRLEGQLKSFQHLWQGDAADQYREMITDLAAGIRKVGDTMVAVRDLDYGAGDALTKARREMPAPVDVPALSPTVVAAATTALPSDPGIPPQTMMALQQQQRDAVDQVNQYQQTVAAANEAHARAVQVMTALANDYSSTESSMPVSPDAGSAPAVPTGGAGVTGDPSLTPVDYTGGGDQGLTGTGTAVLIGGAALAASSPLFGKMFQAGLAAASAAVNGQFTGLRLPSFLNRKKDDGSTDGKAKATADTTTTGDTALPTGLGAGSGTGGVGGGAGLGAGGAGDLSVPSPADALSSAATPSGSALGAAGAAASAAGSAAKSAGFMPAMPMGAGMMGASDMGSGRRVPPWLVETEDVWGESSVVSPTVIGEG
jgi:uncharacterized protein YukE